MQRKCVRSWNIFEKCELIKEIFINYYIVLLFFNRINWSYIVYDIYETNYKLEWSSWILIDHISIFNKFSSNQYLRITWYS